ncbi:hypothetical protein Tco_1417517 [Tanacetum coccineum]
MGVSTASTGFTTANVPVTTAGAEISTASPEVKTTSDSVDDIAAESLVYIRRSAAKIKDKDIQDRIEADEELAQRIQVEEREKYSEAEKARLHHMGSFTLQQLRGYSFDKIKSLFEETMKRVNTFTLMESDVDIIVPKIATGSTKRAAEEELVPKEGMNIEALQTKYPIINWEVFIEDSRMYWKIIRVGNHTEVELKRLFEPDADDALWKSQKHIHDIKWRLYDTYGVHHVSKKDGIDIYILVEREYPLSRGVLTQMLVAKLLVEQNNEMSRELLRMIFNWDQQKPLLKDEDGEEVDVHLYGSMIGSLMYLTSSRPDILFAVCASARYQVNPKVSHLHAVKRIFRYLKGQYKLGLWYPKDSPFDLVAYTDSDYVGASLDRKSTIGGCQFLRCRLISWQCKKQTVGKLMLLGINLLLLEKVNAVRHNLLLLVATVKVKTVSGEQQLQALVDGKKIVVTEASVRRDLQLDDEEGTNCLPNATIFEELTRIGTREELEFEQIKEEHKLDEGEAEVDDAKEAEKSLSNVWNVHR